MAVRAVAHHISQALTVMMGEAQLVREEVNDMSLRASLDRIVRTTEEAAQMIATLRAVRLFAPRESGVEPPAETA